MSSLGDMKYQMDDLDVRYFESALMVISICCHFVVLSSTVNTKTQRSSFILGHIITVEEKKWVGGRLGTRARYASRNTPSHCISIGMPIPLSILAAHLH